MTDKPDRLWTMCEMSEGGLSCHGKGQVLVADSFNVSANGMLVEVVVTQTSWPDQRWTAVDRPQWERRYNVRDEDLPTGD